MSTVGCCQNLSSCCCNKNIAPQQKDTRTIVREEIQRQKQLDKLEEKYNAGKVSKFEYTLQKAIINGMPMYDIPQMTNKGPKLSTTA